MSGLYTLGWFDAFSGLYESNKRNPNMTSNLELIVEGYRTLVGTAVTGSQRTSLMVYLVGHTGMRTDETANFTPDWLSQEDRSISIPEEQDRWSPKSPNCVRKIPLSEIATSLLVTLIEDVPDETFGVAQTTICRRVKSAFEACNIENASPHSLRRLYLNRLNQLGVSPEALAQIAGTNVKTLLPVSEAELIGNARQKIDEHAPLYDEFAFDRD